MTTTKNRGYQLSFALSLSAEEYLAFYEGVARDVLVIADDGRTVRFPAKIIRPFLLHEGIYGRFVIYYDSEHRFKDIQRLSQ